jgi:hypothetical protein
MNSRVPVHWRANLPASLEQRRRRFETSDETTRSIFLHLLIYFAIKMIGIHVKSIA